MNEKIEAFRKRLMDMCKTKAKSKETKEGICDYGDLKVVENTINGDISICKIESLGYDRTEFRRKIGANDIESGVQVAEYILQGLPAGRVCFGGYTDKQCNVGKTLYSFQDVWYKIYGKPLEADKGFTKSELLEASSKIKEKFKDAKYKYIYSIQYKGKNGSEDINYLTQYLSKKNSEIKMFEMIDNQYILTDSYIMDIDIPEFEIKQIESIGSSRVYDRAKFTQEACKQIIKDYEKTMAEER